MYTAERFQLTAEKEFVVKLHNNRNEIYRIAASGRTAVLPNRMGSALRSAGNEGPDENRGKRPEMQE